MIFFSWALLVVEMHISSTKVYDVKANFLIARSMPAFQTVNPMP